jgi:hypothetical protein
MVKIKNPLNSIQASGTAGSLIYARNSYGAYGRNYVSPIQPDSATQLSWRAAMTSANALYENPAILTPLRLELWRQFSQNYKWLNRFGQTVSLSPKEWFVKHNIWMYIAGKTPVNDPPKSPAIYWFPSITIYWDTGGIYMDCYPPPTGQRFVYCRKTGPHSHTRNFCPNTISFGGILDATSGSPLLLVDALDIDTNPHNWWVIYRVVDEFGRTSNKIYVKIYTEGAAPTAVFLPNNSTYLNSYIPNSNFGTAIQVAIQGSGFASTSRGLFSVDLSGLTYTYVDKSYFYFFPTGITNLIGTATYHQDLSSYLFNETTWNIESTGVPWGVPGGSAGTDYTTIPFATFSNTDETQRFYRIDITNQMNSWLSGTTPTRFWGIAATTASKINSRSINYSVPAQRPFILNVPNVAV